MSRTRLAFALAVAALAVVGGISAAAPFPERIELPDGFRPEGIAISGRTFFVGSIPTGAIYSGDLSSGTGSILVPGERERSAIGLAVRGRLLFVAGGVTGRAWVYDKRTGEELARYRLTNRTTFVNDVVATTTAAWFTDSVNKVLYRVPINPDGTPGPPSDVRRVRLTGAIRYVQGVNVNGIDSTRDGSTLILVQSNTGRLFTADPETGQTRRIDLGGALLTNGDGILLDRRVLYVVQNRFNIIVVVQLSDDLKSGVVTLRITDPDLDVPTTIDDFEDRLYVVNARFELPPDPDNAYWITQLAKP